MALWLCRAGKMGEHETKFIEDSSIYCTMWGGIGMEWDMAAITDREAFKAKLREAYPVTSSGRLGNLYGQIWAFSNTMNLGDLAVLPSKIKNVMYVGEIASEYKFSPDVSMPYQHRRSVKWLKELPRNIFDQDLLLSFGHQLTICQVSRNNAEQRIRSLISSPTNALPTAALTSSQSDGNSNNTDGVDIEEASRQEISGKLIAKYKGHGMARLIEAILQAKGYTTYLSPPGPDHGVDILASQGSLGFDHPRICVQVKSGDTPLERTTLDQLIGAMSNHKADFGMLVSWGGFRSSITKETANHFFKVRLWTHKEIIDEFLRHYSDLAEDIRETIPLKRIWTIDKQDD
ncbi:MAG: restriction endonuclease [Defluviitaleaceae bacterium]|nr:restriction endonuclease [Defluviitaleaceae bacterium]